MKKRILIGTLMGSAIALVVGTAAAAPPEYLCSVYYAPGNDNLSGGSARGTLGYISMLVYDAPNCAGTFIGQYYLCSTGATSVECTYQPQFNAYIDAAEMSMAALALSGASYAAKPVSRNIVGCYPNGSGNCIDGIFFH